MLRTFSEVLKKAKHLLASELAQWFWWSIFAPPLALTHSFSTRVSWLTLLSCSLCCLASCVTFAMYCSRSSIAPSFIILKASWHICQLPPVLASLRTLFSSLGFNFVRHHWPRICTKSLFLILYLVRSSLTKCDQNSTISLQSNATQLKDSSSYSNLCLLPSLLFPDSSLRTRLSVYAFLSPYSKQVLGHFDDFVRRCCLSEFCFSRKYYSKWLFSSCLLEVPMLPILLVFVVCFFLHQLQPASKTPWTCLFHSSLFCNLTVHHTAVRGEVSYPLTTSTFSIFLRAVHWPERNPAFSKNPLVLRPSHRTWHFLAAVLQHKLWTPAPSPSVLVPLVLASSVPALPPSMPTEPKYHPDMCGLSGFKRLTLQQRSSIL